MPVAQRSMKQYSTLPDHSPAHTGASACDIGPTVTDPPLPSKSGASTGSARKAPRAKKCKECGHKFQPVRPLQVVCGSLCAVAYARAKVDRMNAKAHREAKAKAKPRSKWMAEAQAAFNRFIRMRDAGQPCISCGRHHEGQYHAGHYLSVGAKPELRFNELNVHLQCQPCNTHLSGNLVNYRTRLLTKIGAEQVQFLEGPHEPKKYTIDDLKQIKTHYAALAKELA